MSPRRYDMSRRRASAERTRRRILDATVELHGERGILATSWEDIARRAGVAVGTVYRHFPSLDELVPACGEISMPRLGLPDAARRRELFAGVSEPRERLRRLVAECYGVYERGDDVVRAVRREPDRRELAAVAEAHARIEEAIGALVDDALAPLDAGPRVAAAMRALCDHDAWRALRRQGLDPDEAVDAAAAMLAGLVAKP
jgi:AcrR family transcriptional regulator